MLRFQRQGRDERANLADICLLELQVWSLLEGINNAAVSRSDLAALRDSPTAHAKR